MGLISKGSKLYSIIHLKCPRCHTGDMFYTGSFSWRRPFDMRSRCAVCGQDFEQEPGFYYGAMFISYIITGWFAILWVLFFHWVLDWSMLMSFLTLILLYGIFFVYIFRFSRAIYLNFYVRYNPNAARSAPQDRPAG